MSTFNFKQVAQNATSLSGLMAGREKLDTGELIGEELTIIQFDLAVIDGKQFAVIVFSEHPEFYYCGGVVLTKMCQAWTAGFDGDIEDASLALSKSGGVKIRLTETRTKNGNNLVNVDIL